MQDRAALDDLETDALGTLVACFLVGVAVAEAALAKALGQDSTCLLYTSPSPRDKRQSRMPSSA